MAARKAPQFHHATHQERSEKTVQRILDCGIELFRSGELGTTSVPAIAERAGVSVGGFYARFPSREDLQRAVVERLLQERHASVKSALAEDALRGLTAREVVRAYAEALVRLFGGRDRELLRRISSHVRNDPELPSSRAIRQFNQEANSLLREALLARRAEMGRDDAEAAIAFFDLATSATAREVLFFGGTGLCEGLAKKTLVDQLTDLGCRLLALD